MTSSLLSDEPRRILLTGGLGFIGTKIVERLAGIDDLLVIDNLHPQVHQDRRRAEGLPTSVRFFEGDVSEPEAMKEAAAFAPDIVVHLAAETGTGQSLLESRRHAEVNVTGTATLLDALSGSGHLPSRLVIPSSRAIYGEGAWSVEGHKDRIVQAVPRSLERLSQREWLPVGPTGETLVTPQPHVAGSSEPRPANVYAATKLAQENVAAAWCTGLGVHLSVLRLQNVYGSGQATGNPYTGVLTFMARQALSGERINVYEGGDIVRDFVNVSDVADALVLAAKDAGPRDVKVDIGSGTPITLLDVARLLSHLAGGPEPRVSDDFRAGDVRAAFAGIHNAREQLGYSPSIGLEEGLTELLRWVSEEAKR